MNQSKAKKAKIQRLALIQSHSIYRNKLFLVRTFSNAEFALITWNRTNFLIFAHVKEIQVRSMKSVFLNGLKNQRYMEITFQDFIPSVKFANLE